ncbi:MAG TPA: hypothetical protein VFC89_06880 [Oscillospiraceae bacterium]|nr:hypothetical protein [Oscillospiraceae bacterium]
MKRIIVMALVFVLMLTLVMPFLVDEVSATGTNCTHQWLHIGEGDAYVYESYTTHSHYKTDVYRCVRCGARTSYLHQQPVAIENHSYGYIDLGHINPYKHEYEPVCNKCSFYANIITVTCYGPPCYAPQSIPVYEK